MEVIRIAGVSVVKGREKQIDYDSLVEMACNTKDYYDKPNRIELVKAELAKHGLHQPDNKKVSESKSSTNTRKPNKRKQGANSPSGKGAVEAGS